MSDSNVIVGARVVECMIDTTRPDLPVRGRIVAVCAKCDEATVQCDNGYTERVPLDRFGHDRPQARWRVLP